MQVWHRIDIDKVHLDLGARAYGTTKRSFVDYTGEFGGHARLRYRLKERISLIASADAVHMRTDTSVAGRSGIAEGRLREVYVLTVMLSHSNYSLPLRSASMLPRSIDCPERGAWPAFAFLVGTKFLHLRTESRV